ncbi:MAG: xanthine dehydrogenase family protein subunit M [Hyphomicrobiales bacterium]|jgi:carbon-monoxide dehydrogenase medium subunit|nr:xanthine dehydrogenase family protein subunit M [Hyphomicrobiales bacterium]
MYPFNYHRAASLQEAAKLLTGEPEAKLLAGGQTLLPTMKQRLAGPSDLIDLTGIASLKVIKADKNGVQIGAMTTHAEVAASKDVQNAIPALAALAGDIGDPHVRAAGTIGGSVANNDPAADYPAACLGLAATVITNHRTISADEFFTGLFETALNDEEIITAVNFPIPAQAGYVKFKNPASRYAIVGVFAARTGGGARVAVTGAGAEGVFRVKEMEAALDKNFSPDAVAGISVSADGFNSDIHASAEYRAHLVTVMAKRAVAAAR